MSLETQEEKRTVRIGLRVTPTERQLMWDAAKREHMGLSLWIRRLLLKALE